jgi:dipeptidase E
MKRIVLFSMPTDKNIGKLSDFLFPYGLQNKILAYLPSNGSDTKQVYTDYWKKIANKKNAEFLFVDNLLPESAKESKKLKGANILLITGGNTFELLYNLRKSELDKTIINFSKKEEFVIGGFSAGAIVLSPTIKTASVPSGNDPEDFVDENNVGITDLTGLNIINFEIIPHYDKKKDKQTLENYRKTTTNEVKKIGDNEVVVLDL